MHGKGFHSLPLHIDDRHYTTFITPWGRYRYRVVTQGYISSGDAYTRRFDELICGIPNKTKCVDDTCLWAPDITQSFFQVCQFLDICGRNGIIQNPEKFVFGADEVEFAGFEITNDCVRPCRKYFQSIMNFPKPQNKVDIQSWFGLINQVAFSFSMAPAMLPFRELLSNNAKFYWDEKLDVLFEQSKRVIIQQTEEGVRIYDKNRPTCLATDWSKTGISYSLFQ